MTKESQTSKSSGPLTIKNLCSFGFYETTQWALFAYGKFFLKGKNSTYPSHICICSFESGTFAAPSFWSESLRNIVNILGLTANFAFHCKITFIKWQNTNKKLFMYFLIFSDDRNYAVTATVLLRDFHTLICKTN